MKGAIYRYHHQACGFAQDVYLEHEHRDYTQMQCYRCGATVTARRVRDKSVKIKEADGTVGVLKREQKANP